MHEGCTSDAQNGTLSHRAMNINRWPIQLANGVKYDGYSRHTDVRSENRSLGARNISSTENRIKTNTASALVQIARGPGAHLGELISVFRLCALEAASHSLTVIPSAPAIMHAVVMPMKSPWSTTPTVFLSCSAAAGTSLI